MNQTETIQATPCKRSRRVQAAALTGIAAALVPAAGVTFAAPPSADVVAGGVVTDIGADGASFVATYGIPALGVALGIALTWGLLRRVGKRVIGSF